MKKLFMVFVSGFVLIAVGLVILIVFSINRGGIVVTSEKDSRLKLVNTQNISLDDIDFLRIDYSYEDVVFLASDTKELVLKEYKNYEPDKDELADIRNNGSEIEIRGGRHTVELFGSWNRYGRTEVYLPMDYANKLFVKTSSGDISSDLVLKLSQFSAHLSSGDIELNEIYTEQIDVSSSSGNITIEKAEGAREISSSSGDIKVLGGNGDSEFEASSGSINVEKASGRLSAKANSGDIKIIDSEGEKSIETTSGNITVEKAIGTVQASASSGDIKVDSLKGSGNINTNSGSVTFELEEVTGDINLEASSGDVYLKLPTSTSCIFTADTSSGDIRTFFDDRLSFGKDKDHASGTIGENPIINIQIATTSGSIKVKQN